MSPPKPKKMQKLLSVFSTQTIPLIFEVIFKKYSSFFHRIFVLVATYVKWSRATIKKSPFKNTNKVYTLTQISISYDILYY